MLSNIIQKYQKVENIKQKTVKSPFLSPIAHDPIVYCKTSGDTL